MQIRTNNIESAVKGKIFQLGHLNINYSFPIYTLTIYPNGAIYLSFQRLGKINQKKKKKKKKDKKQILLLGNLVLQNLGGHKFYPS